MPRSLAFLVTLLLVLGIASPAPWGPTASGQDEPTARVIVKLRAPLAREVESSLAAPTSLLDAADATLSEGPRAFLNRHRGQRLRALYPGLIRAKRELGGNARAVALASRRRFASRAARRRGGFEPPDLSRTYVIEVPASNREALNDAIAALSRDAEVEYAEEDHVVPLHFLPDDPYLSTAGSWGQAYDDLYGVKTIGAPAAWDVTDGSGIVVAVVDTGIDVAHPDIAANVWTNPGEIPGNGFDDDGNGFVDDTHGWDFVGVSYGSPVEDNDPDDRYGHGTHVAGTIAATGNNGIGVVGVAFGARVMAVKGLSDSGSGLDSTLASAVYYAVDNGADVINASFGGYGTSQTLLDAVDYAHSLGVVFVASAGNSADDASLYYPAGFANAITVAASNASDGVASFSNWGSKIDVAAPGVDVLSLRAAGTTRLTPLGTDYARASGTSMAAPHVSGLVALLMSLHPEFTNEQVRQVLRASAFDTDGNGVDPLTGFGRVDAAVAVTIDAPLEAHLLAPDRGQHVYSATTVSGTATGPGFSYFELELGAGETPEPDSFAQFAVGSTPVSDGTLGVLDPSGFPDGTYTLRLRVFDDLGHAFVDQTTVVIDYVAIASPLPPIAPSTAEIFKPGELVTVEGRATGAGFLSYGVEWARGLEPSGDWSDSGVTLVDNGMAPVDDGTVATWDTTSLALDDADFYTIRLVVDNGAFVSESRTRVYLEPDLLSPHWPWPIDAIPQLYGGVVSAIQDTGDKRLALNIPYSLAKHARYASFSPDGSDMTSADMWGGPFQQPLAADLDGIPGDEVAVNEGLQIRVYRQDLSNYTLPTTMSVNFQYGVATAADLDGDGTQEILAVGVGYSDESAHLHAWRSDGQQVSLNFPLALADTGRKTHYQAYKWGPRFLVLDLEDDGGLDIVAAEGPSASSFRFSLFDANGEARVWDAPQIEGRLTQMLAADLDGDGRFEIVASYQVGLEAFVTVLESSGAVRLGWPIQVSSGTSEDSYLAAGDLDRDGSDEVVVSTQSRILALRGNGTSFSPQWPYKNCNCWAPILVDVDGDGYLEILVTEYHYTSAPPLSDGATSDIEPSSYPATVTSPETRVLAIGSDASVTRSWRLLGLNGGQGIGVWTSIAADDYDSNGTLDIAVTYPLIGGTVGMVNYVTSGVLTVLSTGAPAAPELQDWPMNTHDSKNSGVRWRPDVEPPTVVVTAPLEGDTVSGTVTLTADATDNGRVVGVRFYIDSVPVGAEDTTAPYASGWNSRGVPNGSHAITAEARDFLGNRTTSAPVTVTVDNDLIPPTVAITSPADGALLRGQQTVTADASDNVGVVGVQFRVDGVNLGPEDTEAPYAATWDTASSFNGSHTLTAVARDAAGNITISAGVFLATDNQPPVTSLTAPLAGAFLSGTTTMTASATDNRQVAGVQFQIDGVPFGAEDVTPPYAIDWDATTVADGSYTLSAVARDTAGNVASTAPVNVTVDHVAPLVALTAPLEGQIVTGTVSIEADASDDRSLARVEFLIDGYLAYTDTTSPYAYSWSSGGVPNGNHVLTAKAHDAAGNVTASLPVDVVVSNTSVDAVYDPSLKVPRCSSPASVCDSALLLRGRAGLGPEPNQPNTIHNSCFDGTAGTFHSDESLDQIRVSSVDGGIMAPGKLARIRVSLWAYYGYTSDKLDLYYASDASNPNWIFITTLTPTSSGSQTLTATYTLPPGADQAVRGRFRYGGSATPCGAGSYNDHDDLVFAVETPDDDIPPTVEITSPSEGAAVGGTVTITADANDDLSLARVDFLIDGIVSFTDTTGPYEYAWDTSTVPNGSHQLLARAYDAAGNVGESAITTVNVSNSGGTALYDPIAKAPNCGSVGSYCDSGTLLDGRGPLGEITAPNTIFDSCGDGAYGQYHRDESNDKIRIETLDGTPFAAGKTVRVTATVWAYSAYTSDKLDLYYAADASSPSWTFVTTLTPTGPGAQTLVATYVLPAGSRQAVRARFRYGGSATACGAGGYNDHDDLIFAVTP